MGSIVKLTQTSDERVRRESVRARVQAREDAEQERFLRAWREQHGAGRKRRSLLRPWQHAA
jgi:hypothetical protein